MEIIFKKPEIEPNFVVTIYTRRNAPGVYRVNVGKEATDGGMGNDEMPIGNYVEQSDFLPSSEVEPWLDERIAALKRDGKPVVFDNNFKYLMSRMIAELAEESPVNVPQSL